MVHGVADSVLVFSPTVHLFSDSRKPQISYNINIPEGVQVLGSPKEEFSKDNLLRVHFQGTKLEQGQSSPKAGLYLAGVSHV